MARRVAATAVVGVAALLAVVAGPAALATSEAEAAVPQMCKYSYGVPLTKQPWPQLTLDYAALHQISTGTYQVSGHTSTGQAVRAGDPVKIAVIDSGFDPSNPVFRGVDAVREIHGIAAIPGVTDCLGHGTEVTSVIAAQPGTSPMTGIAPRARIVPIVYTNSDTDSPPATVLASCIRKAIEQHVQIINMSLQDSVNTRAVRTQIAAAEAAGIVVVAAGGNENSGKPGPYYPAALSPQYSNVIAVSAVAQSGAAANFNFNGSYIDVAAPGDDVPLAVRGRGFLLNGIGTSFAAPLVAGTVALMLSLNPSMTPRQVRDRLEATADPPPGDDPNAHYGHGIVNPLQAITSVRSDSAATPQPGRGTEIAAPGPDNGPGRGLEHRAIAIAVVLLALAVLTVVGAAILRGGRRAGRA